LEQQVFYLQIRVGASNIVESANRLGAGLDPGAKFCPTDFVLEEAQSVDAVLDVNRSNGATNPCLIQDQSGLGDWRAALVEQRVGLELI